MAQATLSINKLSKTYSTLQQNQEVLKEVTCSIVQGRSYAVTGASGCGKSTFLHCVGALDAPTSGTVTYDQINIHLLKPAQRNSLLNQTFGFVFQFHYLIKELTVLENVIVPGLIKGKSSKDCYSRGKELLDRVGLNAKLNSYPWQLSGGEQQRVAIVRALFNKPQFLFADEPTGNLDEENAQQIGELFLQFQKDSNMGLIICSHDRAVYSRMDTVWHLNQGTLEMLEAGGGNGD